jgi:glycosyltransferase involved in cell wall biosynthesis
MITIFTPVYNRAAVLENLYQSLWRQTAYDFEWLIIDDGSTDSIAEVVYHWMETESVPFPIRFYQQENGGKHRAINRGVQLAQGEAFFIVDSDDCLTEDAVEWIHKWWEDVADNDGYAGIAGLRGNRNRDVIGDIPHFEVYVDATNLERSEYGLLGDKAEVYKTSVLRKEPFPEFEGENFLTEATVWDRIAYEGLKIRWFNQVIYLCEYRADGLTSQGWEVFIKNPVGWGLYIRQKCLFYHLNAEERTEQYLEYYIFMRGRLSERQIQHNLGIQEEEFAKIKVHYEQCIEKTASNIGRTLGMYGAGLRGKKVLEFYRGTKIRISFVLDRKKADVSCRQIALEGPYPKVDRILITPKDGQSEIREFLTGQTDNKIIGYDEWKECIGFGEIF